MGNITCCIFSPSTDSDIVGTCSRRYKQKSWNLRNKEYIVFFFYFSGSDVHIKNDFVLILEIREYMMNYKIVVSFIFI